VLEAPLVDQDVLKKEGGDGQEGPAFTTNAITAVSHAFPLVVVVHVDVKRELFVFGVRTGGHGALGLVLLVSIEEGRLSPFFGMLQHGRDVDGPQIDSDGRARREEVFKGVFGGKGNVANGRDLLVVDEADRPFPVVGGPLFPGLIGRGLDPFEGVAHGEVVLVELLKGDRHGGSKGEGGKLKLNSKNEKGTEKRERNRFLKK
jgi:hypothetical protein